MYLDSNDVKATGLYMKDNRFKVNKDSHISESESPSCRPNLKQKQKELVDNGIVKDGVFVTDYVFGSPSTAASCILGGDKNGRTLWKNGTGVILKNLYPDKDDNMDDGQLSLGDIISEQ